MTDMETKTAFIRDETRRTAVVYRSPDALPRAMNARTNRYVPAVRSSRLPSVSTFVGGTIDRAVLGFMNRPDSHPVLADLDRLAAEVAAASALYRTRKLLGNPAAFHREPEPLTTPRIERGGSWPLRYAWLSFPSGYAPDPEDPAASRWGSYERNRTAHAWIVRHRDRSKPYLICIHGMGAVTVGDRIYVIGGGTVAGLGASRANEAFGVQ